MALFVLVLGKRTAGRGEGSVFALRQTGDVFVFVLSERTGVGRGGDASV